MNIRAWLFSDQLVNQVNAVEGEYRLWGIAQFHFDTYTLNGLRSLPQRRIEDRIRELCAKAVAATDGDLEPALRELSQLLRGTIEHMRKGAKSLLVEGKPLVEPRTFSAPSGPNQELRVLTQFVNG
jgi:hypothetical protein